MTPTLMAAMIGAWEVLLILAVLLIFPLLALLVVLIVVRRSRVKVPKPPAPAPPVVSPETQRLPRACPQCGTPLGTGVPEGLCPVCLLQHGVATEGGGAGTGTFVPPTLAELAKLFPQLEILEPIGKGGMGAVYKARQPALDRFVALKILAPKPGNDADFASRFSREARALARLSHPNIVAVYDFGQAGGLSYFIMEYVDGPNLRQVQKAGRLAPREALEIIPQICTALQFAHDEGIVHRDIKPENVLLDKKGRVKIADFGLAKILGQETRDFRLTGEKEVMGTPHYMAPEQVEKPQEVDHRADIFSLGVVFYEMLTGELPLGKFAPPSQKVQVDVRLDEVVLRALEKEPGRRYQQARDVKTRIDTIAATPGAAGAPPVAALPGESAGLVITAPAVALLIVAAWKILSALTGALVLSGVGLGVLGSLFDTLGGSLLSWGSFTVIGIVLLKLVPAALICHGALKMLRRQSHAWGLAAAMLSILSCSVLGLPVGIWAMVVLSRQDVRAVFDGTAAPNGTGGVRSFSWKWAPGLGAAGLILVATGLMLALLLVLPTARGNSTSAERTEHFEMTFQLVPTGTFSLENVNGNIEVTGWERDEVAVSGIKRGTSAEQVAAIRTDVESSTNRVTIRTRPPAGRLFNWLPWGKKPDPKVDYTIRVPRPARLDNLKTVNGEIVVRDISGDINASVVNGNARLKQLAGNLKFSAVNGEVVAEMASLGADKSVSIDCVNGAIDLTLPAEADTRINASTVNGRITSEFAALPSGPEALPGGRLQGVLGNGSATVKITTVNGGISLRRGGVTAFPKAVVPENPELEAADKPVILNFENQQTEFLAIGTVTGTNRIWWHPNGRLMTNDLGMQSQIGRIPFTSMRGLPARSLRFPAGGSPSEKDRDDSRTYELVFRTPPGSFLDKVEVEKAKYSLRPYFVYPKWTPPAPPPQPKYFAIGTIELPPNRKHADCTIELPGGPWLIDERIAGWEQGAKAGLKITCGGLLWTVGVQLAETNHLVRLTGYHPIHWSEGWDHQLVLLAGNGQAYSYSTNESTLRHGYITLNDVNETYENIALENIAAVRFRIRPRQKFTFRNFSLEPGFQTQVEVIREPIARQLPGDFQVRPFTEPDPASTVTNLETNLSTAQPSAVVASDINSQVRAAHEARVRELTARFDAAKGILAFPEKDTAMATLARDAAKLGEVEFVKKALGQMTAFTARDEATRLAVRELARGGHRTEAVEIARTITAFPTRDATLRELANE